MEEYMKVWGLCQICNETRQYPSLKPLHDKALAELTELAKEAEEWLKEKAEEAAKEAAEKAAKEAAKAKEEAEAQQTGHEVTYANSRRG